MGDKMHDEGYERHTRVMKRAQELGASVGQLEYYFRTGRKVTKYGRKINQKKEGEQNGTP